MAGLGEAGAALGIISASISLLLNAIPAVIDRTERYRSCSDCLNRYKWDLTDCKGKLDDWEAIWKWQNNLTGHHPASDQFTDESYVYFWTEDGYTRVKRQYDLILKTIKALKTTLGIERRRNGPLMANELESTRTEGSQPGTLINEQDELSEASSGTGGSGHEPMERRQRIFNRNIFRLRRGNLRLPEFDDVQSTLSEQDWETWWQDSGEPAVRTRIAFALWRQNSLDSNLLILRREVESLCGYSSTTYRRMQYRTDQSVESIVTQLEVQKSERLRKFEQDVQNFSITLNDRISSADSDWQLDLQFVDSADCSQMPIAEFDISLTNIVEGLSENSLERFTVSYQRYLERNEPSLRPRPGRETEQPVQRLSIPFREIFQRVNFESSNSAGMQNYKSWEHDRARLLLGFVNWSILLWNGPWVKDLCCCGIRFGDTSNNGSYQSYHILALRPSHQCQNLPRKLLLLGVVIAELLLAKPVRIAQMEPGTTCIDSQQYYCDDQQYHLQLWDRSDAPEGRWNDISRETLCNKIYTRTMSNSVKNAVEFCLDQRELAAQDATAFRAEFLSQYITHIFEPIRKYCTHITEQRQQYSTLRWSQRLNVIQPWPPNDASLFEWNNLPPEESDRPRPARPWLNETTILGGSLVGRFLSRLWNLARAAVGAFLD